MPTKIAPTLVVAMLCLGLLAQGASADIVANFDTDSYPDAAGEGWVGGWGFTGTGAASIQNSSPLDSGSDYLGVTNSGNRALVREYTSFDNIETDNAHTISWKWRYDGPDLSTFTTFEDRVHFFADDDVTGSTNSGNSWIIVAAGTPNGSGAPPTAQNFAFFDSKTELPANNSFVAANLIDTGIALDSGDIYSFSVTVEPINKTYSATITNETDDTSFTRTDMDFRNTSSAGDVHTTLHFGNVVSSGSDVNPFSIDSVRITEPTEIVNNFDQGNSTVFSDAFGGRKGGGWLGAWSVTSGTGTPSVETTDPLNGAGDPYLAVDLTGAANRTIARQAGTYGQVDLSSLHRITWQWRFDGDEGDFASANDRIHFFGDDGAAGGSGVGNSWLIGVTANRSGFGAVNGEWYLFDGTDGNGFAVSNLFDTNLVFDPDALYEFEVIVDPTNGTYSASIFDGTTLVSATDLAFRNGLTGQFDYLHFGASASGSGDNLNFALDSIRITAIPEPSAMLLGLVAGGGLFGLMLGRRGKRGNT